MANIYHGSRSRYLAERVVSILRRPIRKVRRLLRNGRRPDVDPALSRLWDESQDLLERGQPLAALEQLKAAARSIESGNHSLAIKVGRGLIALGETDRGAKLIMDNERRHLGAAAWSGEPLGDRTLLIDWPRGNLERDIGFGLMCLNYVARASRLAKRCIVIVEPRLAALYRRTLNTAEVYSINEITKAVRAQADCVTSLHYLAALFRESSPAADRFVPIQADAQLVRDFRSSYEHETGNRLKLVGISWGSKVTGREAPSFDDWANLMRLTSANFVSLQYGQVHAAVRTLRESSQRQLIYDTSVDQLKDMDRFAAQVSALDAVISINNTIAHTAGAMNIPSVVILGNTYTDWHHRDGRQSNWSLKSDRYPNSLLVLKGERNWHLTMDEARSSLTSLITEMGQRSQSN